VARCLSANSIVWTAIQARVGQASPSSMRILALEMHVSRPNEQSHQTQRLELAMIWLSLKAVGASQRISVVSPTRVYHTSTTARRSRVFDEARSWHLP
jgi:hypothetical protein